MICKAQLDEFKNKRIIIIGDVMIDEYIYGTIDRISPEAPVPILLKSDVKARLGGAANVAKNLLALGAEPYLIATTGKDDYAQWLRNTLENAGIRYTLAADDTRSTTLKTRLMAGGNQILRVDTEKCHDIPATIEEELYEAFIYQIENETVDGIILQDYNKGVLTPSLITAVLSYCSQNGIPTFVDPKSDNFFLYKHCTVFKPNKKELLSALRMTDGQMKEAVDEVFARINPEVVFCTLSEDGICFKDNNTTATIPTEKIDVVDVSGAGDTALSVIALAYLSGLDNEQIAILANIAGGQVCRKAEVSEISLSELKSGMT